MAVDALTTSLERLRRLGMAVGETKEVDTALAATRQLLQAASVAYRIVGGIAVHHHGYRRYTEDVDVLIDAADAGRLDAQLASHGFGRDRPRRLRHLASDVTVDLLLSGEPLPRRTDVAYPRPQDVDGSPSNPDVVALGPLLRLKLLASRRQDEADVVALLKLVDETRYATLEATMDPELRSRLASLRDEALEELRFDDA